jgi:hypothetical protein
MSSSPTAAATKTYSLTATTYNTPTDAPALIDVAAVRDFVMGITTDNAAQWCQFNNSSVWTTGTNQADKQPSLWGQMRRIVGGEYGIILTDKAVVRVSYVGSVNDIIFQFDEISAEVGCMAAGSVCNVGRLIFFLSERGFMMCDGQEVLPIGDEKFNRWFFSTYSRADIAASGRDRPAQQRSEVGHARRYRADHQLQLGAEARHHHRDRRDRDLHGIYVGVSLDALDAIYGDLDSITISLDDASLAGRQPSSPARQQRQRAGFADRGQSGSALRLNNIEPTPGRRSRIRNLRLVSDTTDASATVDARMREGDANMVSAATMRTNGKLPIRANGRYNTVEVVIPAATDWTNIQGCEIEFEAGDGR